MLLPYQAPSNAMIAMTYVYPYDTALPYLD